MVREHKIFQRLPLAGCQIAGLQIIGHQSGVGFVTDSHRGPRFIVFWNLVNRPRIVGKNTDHLMHGESA